MLFIRFKHILKVLIRLYIFKPDDESLNGTVVVIKDPTADWFCLFKPSNHSSGDRCYSDKLQFFIERVVEGQEKRHAIEFQR